MLPVYEHGAPTSPGGGGGGGGGLSLAQIRTGLKLSPQAEVLARGATVRQTITAAQTLDLHNTPIRIGPAVAADQVIFPRLYVYKPAGVAGTGEGEMTFYFDTDGTDSSTDWFSSSAFFFQSASAEYQAIDALAQGILPKGKALWVNMSEAMTAQNQDITIFMVYDLWRL